MSRIFSAGLIVGLFVFPAGAYYGGGQGTADQPYLISTAAHLTAIGSTPSDWDKCFKLTANIDMRNVSPTQYKRIGTPEDRPFRGVFDGNYKTISNFRLHSEEGSYLGLFGIVDGASARIVNVTLLDPDVAGDNGRYVGALVGLVSNGTFANCHVRGGSIRGASFVGGLIARKAGGTAVTDCTTVGTVRGGARVGGLIGANLGADVTRCHAAGEVWGDASSWSVAGLIGENESAEVTACHADSKVQGNDRVGGLIGDNIRGTASRCWADGTVQGNTNVGGLIGQNTGGKTYDCYAMAAVTGGTPVGGLVGYNAPTCSCTVYVSSLITRSYAAGRVRGTNAGGLVGLSFRSSTETSFWDIATTGCTFSDGGMGKTSVQMYSLATYVGAGWDFAGEKTNGTLDIWCLPVPKGYPQFTWERTGVDFNADNRVDLRDFALLAKCWRQADTASWSGGRYVAADGVVNFDDLGNLADQWLAHRR